ncbi:hypothetical protein DXG01_013732 [Tephrocybe rancida]|nr:hypothetical protein DXG01_013732 [Tephrocybe rancida]
MEGQNTNSLKHAIHHNDLSEPANKRMKPTDPVGADTASSLSIMEAQGTGEGSPAAGEKSSTSVADAQPQPPKGKSQDKRGRHGRKDDRKDGKKGVGRRRRGTRNDEAAAEGAGTASDEPKAARLPKRQSALLIGFCGTGYSGMQIQPDHTKTIEGVLFQALVRAGAVSQDNADDPVKIGLARAARTDAGVHAAGNLVSLKMITSIPDVPDVVARVNEELPPEIRLWGFVRLALNSRSELVQRPFVRYHPLLYLTWGPSEAPAEPPLSRVCDSRKYTYFFPTYLLIPPKPGSGLHRSLQEYAATLSPDLANTKPLHSFWANSDLSSHEGEMARKRAWRVDAEQVERLRAAAKRFEGTHNFHNFTVARDFSDRSNQRHMKKIEIADPVVYGDTEWISVLFHGQSFMLHQLYGPRVVFIPKMPSLGLLLEEPIFDSYNTRMAATVNTKLEPSHADYRPPISFDAHRAEIDVFKQKYIYDNMRLVEDRDGLFDAWMRHLDAYSGSDLLYLNRKGTIPPGAIIKKNERRENPFKEKKRFDATGFSVDDEAVKGDEDEEEATISKKDLADTEG